MADAIRFESRMSDSDALMWNIEKDPLLRSTIAVVWLLESAPDHARLEAKIERATRTIPRLRQHVVSNPASIAPPRWEADPSFDLRYHLRWLRAPGAGEVRDVLDFASPVVMAGFDRAQPSHVGVDRIDATPVRGRQRDQVGIGPRAAHGRRRPASGEAGFSGKRSGRSLDP